MLNHCFSMPGLIALGFFLTACAGDPARVGAGEASACTESENLLLDPGFSQLERGPWKYSQHARERSFSVTSEDGVLVLTRTGNEPWMILQQYLKNPGFAGATFRFSAELKGEILVDPPLHGFKHVAGLYLKPGHGGKARSAEHEPNQGSWDWQRVSVEQVMPAAETAVLAGFVHQGGGSLWVRNPRLVLVHCPQ